MEIIEMKWKDLNLDEVYFHDNSPWNFLREKNEIGDYDYMITYSDHISYTIIYKMPECINNMLRMERKSGEIINEFKDIFKIK